MLGRGKLALALTLLACALAPTAQAQATAPVFYTKVAIGQVAPAVPFTATTGAAFIEGVGGSKITCKAGTATGEVAGATTVRDVRALYTGCENSGSSFENRGPGEIEFEPLEGSLGNVVAGKTPGLRLWSEAHGKGGEMAVFSGYGGAIAVKVAGSIIASLSGASGTEPAAGKLAAAIKLTYSESKGIQKYTSFVSGEGEPGEEQERWSIGGSPYERWGWSQVWTIKSTPAGNLGMTL
jgi:hypothetical protein